MKLRYLVALLLIGMVLFMLGARWIAPHGYEKQFRDFVAVNPSKDFLLGTDALGRDRFARLLYGSRLSLILAPAAAAVSVFLAALIGGIAAFAGRRWESVIMLATDLTLSLPWLFLLLTIRGAMPLDVQPGISVLITFLVLGLLGWAGPARVVRAGVKKIIASDFVFQANAMGTSRSRIFFRYVLPNVRPVLMAQFWISLPVFILSEANLGAMGLSVSEPMPSWGNLLRELESQTSALEHPFLNWWLLAPIVLLVGVVSLLQYWQQHPKGSQ
jgi:peptide/nickel transport system permease protein